MNAIDWNKPIEPLLGAGYKSGATARLLHILSGPGVPANRFVVLVHYGDGSEGVYHCNAEGVSLQSEMGPDVQNVVPPVQQRQYWVNIYEGQHLDCFHRDRLAADTAASPKRIACVPVTVEFRPGDGL